MTIWAWLVAFIYEIGHYEWMHVPWIPLSVIGTAVAFYIGFKNNQAYDRLWEARKIWGAIVNDSRTLVLQLKSFTVYNKNPYHPITKTMALRQIAWTYALGQSLRKEDPFNNLDRFINEDEIERLKKHTNVPLGIIQLQSSDIKKLLDILVQSISAAQLVISGTPPSTSALLSAIFAASLEA